jgi:hypothetical protein
MSKDDNHNVIDHADAVFPHFAVIKAVIDQRQNGTLKDANCRFKTKTVLGNVGNILCRASFAHRHTL